MRAQNLSAFLLAGLAGLATASPLAVRQAASPTVTAPGPGATGNPGSSDVDMVAAIKAIMPSSDTCDGATAPDDCRTAEQAAPFVSKSLEGFSPGQKAGVLALMGLESVEFKYKHNVFPGRPGQGTANMMMIGFVTKYAIDMVGQDQVAGKGPNEILALVTVDEHNFGSGAWFLTTQCNAQVQAALTTGTDAGWLAYNTCIGVDGSIPERMAFWNRAKEVFKL